MKRSTAVFLKIALVLIGIAAIALLLWEPHLEGRNANATLFQIYFNDPFLTYVYIASIAFFIALYQAFRVLGYAGQKKLYSQGAVKALRAIRYCALSLIVFIAGAEAYFFLVQRTRDDIAGGVAMGLFLMIVSAVFATAAAVFERTLQNAVDSKSGVDLRR